MSEAPYYVIGIDAGGTATRGQLADPDGAVLAACETGPSNVQTLGVEQCARVVDDAVASLCIDARAPQSAVPVVVFGAAGAGRESDQRRMRGAVQALWEERDDHPRSILVVSDADIALEAAFGDEPGIVIIAGTGSIVYGRDAGGAIRRCGGWGPVLGDPGSGAALGLAALRHAAKVFDGCAQPTLLTALLAKSAGIDSGEALIAKVYHDGTAPATLAPLVFEAASDGDGAAQTILTNAAEELAHMFECAVRQFAFSSEIPVALMGGLLQSANSYHDHLASAISARVPKSRIQALRHAPADGAIAMALRMTRSKQHGG